MTEIDRLCGLVHSSHRLMTYEVKQLKEKFQLEMREHFWGAVKELFIQNPELKSFGWRQFEPWRDGEETEFEVQKDEDELIINGIYPWDWESDEEEEIHGKLSRPVAAFLEKFNDEVLESIFGSSNEITFTPAQLTIEDYSD